MKEKLATTISGKDDSSIPAGYKVIKPQSFALSNKAINEIFILVKSNQLPRIDCGKTDFHDGAKISNCQTKY